MAVVTSETQPWAYHRLETSHLEPRFAMPQALLSEQYLESRYFGMGVREGVCEGQRGNGGA